MCSKELAERQAHSYKEHNEAQHRFGLKMIDMLDLNSGALTVLDFGCGTGNLTKVLSERVGADGKVIAVDPDGERLKIARESFSSSNIEYIEADDKTFPEGQYDLVFANIVLHWIKDKKSLFERVYRNLKKGGRFAFVIFNGAPAQNHEVVKRIFEELVSPDFFHTLFTTKLFGMTLSEYENLAVSAGFVKMCAESEHICEKWKNLDDCVYKWFSELHTGAFDPEKFDAEKMQKLKEEYGDGEIVYDEPNQSLLYMIFVKP